MAPKGDLAVNQRLELGQEAEEAVEKKKSPAVPLQLFHWGVPGAPSPCAFCLSLSP